MNKNTDICINNKIKTINIKYDFPPSDVAVFDLWKEIVMSKKEGYKVIKVIHGYGSHGKGGEIKRAIHEFLLNEKKNKLIVEYVKGEEWSSNNETVKKIQEFFPELVIDEDLKNINSGISVVVLSY